MILEKFVYDILSIPATLTKKMLEGIRDEIDRERLITEESIKQKLQELQLQLQDEKMTEQEYEELEIMLIERLKAVREYRSLQEDE
jgi:hypothetical protein